MPLLENICQNVVLHVKFRKHTRSTMYKNDVRIQVDCDVQYQCLGVNSKPNFKKQYSIKRYNKQMRFRVHMNNQN